MNIIIEGKRGVYKVESDDRQYIIQEEKIIQEDTKNSKKGDKYWSHVAFISSYPNLINRLIDLEVRRSDATTLLELKNEYISTSKFIRKLLEG